MQCFWYAVIFWRPYSWHHFITIIVTIILADNTTHHCHTSPINRWKGKKYFTALKFYKEYFSIL